MVICSFYKGTKKNPQNQAYFAFQPYLYEKKANPFKKIILRYLLLNKNII